MKLEILATYPSKDRDKSLFTYVYTTLKTSAALKSRVLGQNAHTSMHEDPPTSVHFSIDLTV